MEWLLITFGAKLCCIFGSTLGGITNWIVNRKIKIWDIGVAVLVGVISAEILIPAIMGYWELPMTAGPAIAFLIGYCGIRLLPRLEKALFNKIEKL
tara:strand:- start:271 stop:558 length:288 start_codon:yes stop_codon:yes gene_type:complete